MKNNKGEIQKVSLLKKFGFWLTSWFKNEPNFLVIGSQKAGTTSLHHYLLQHPEVFLPRIKELNYFAFTYYRGVNSFKSKFNAKWNKRGAVGEISPYYLVYPNAPERVFKYNKDIKLIVLLRNPVKRLYSHFNFAKQEGMIPHELSLKEVLDLEAKHLQEESDKILANPAYRSYFHQRYSLLARSLYYEQLTKWLKFFPRENILLINADEMFKDKTAALTDIYNFLEIEHIFPSNTDKTFNKTKIKSDNDEIDSAYLDLIKRDAALLSSELGFTQNWFK